MAKAMLRTKIEERVITEALALIQKNGSTTISEVAKKAGCHYSTASLLLKGYEEIFRYEHHKGGVKRYYQRK